MPVLPQLAATALALSPVAASPATSAAEALSIVRTGPVMEEPNQLSRGEIYPLVGLTALAVLALVLLSDDVDVQEPSSA